MRIIAGSLKGRNISSPKGHKTHPMSEKARGAIFNILGEIDGFTVLDAFAGSGACSIEAVSRGAKSVVSIDISKEAFECINNNVRVLDIADKVKVSRANISTWLQNNSEFKFDLIIADPPYNDLHSEVINTLSNHLYSGGILVLSWPISEELPSISILQIVKDKSYGDARLVFYKKES